MKKIFVCLLLTIGALGLGYGSLSHLRSQRAHALQNHFLNQMRTLEGGFDLYRQAHGGEYPKGFSSPIMTVGLNALLLGADGNGAGGACDRIYEMRPQVGLEPDGRYSNIRLSIDRNDSLDPTDRIGRLPHFWVAVEINGKVEIYAQWGFMSPKEFLPQLQQLKALSDQYKIPFDDIQITYIQLLIGRAGT